MDAEVVARRLSVLHGHMLGLERQECCASGIAMQNCAASSAIAYARPAACALPHGRRSQLEGKGRHEEEALRAAELVLGNKLVPIKGSIAPEAPPAFAKAAGDDARVLQAVAEAHAAFERSLLSSKQQAGTSTKAEASAKKRGIGLRVNALQSNTCHTLQLALPGVRAEDLRVEVNGQQLTVSGRRPVIPVHGRAVAPAIYRTDKGLAPKQKWTSFTSTWRLPADADSRRASAELDNGVLRVSFWRNS